MAAQSDLRFTGVRRTRYRAVVEPRRARLKLTSDWRIFQTLSVPHIASAMLKKHARTLDYEQRASNPRETREFCIQTCHSTRKRIVAELPRAKDYS